MTTQTDKLLIQFEADASKALAPLKRLEQQTKQTQQAFNKVGANSRKLTASFQNVGYQVQDFAVQVGGGTDAMRAFSQQAPQLLSAFGGLGVAVGTAVAVLGPLAKSFFDSGESAEKAAKQTDKMAEAIKGLVSPSTGLASLNELLSESESKFAGLAGALKTSALAKAKKDLADLEKEVSTLVGTLTQVGEGNTVARYLVLDAKGYSVAEAQYKALNEYIADLYGVSEETAGSIQNLAKQFQDGAISVENFAEGVLALGVDPNTEGYEKLLELLKQIATEGQRVKELSKIDIELRVKGDSLQEAIDSWDEYMESLKDYADNVKRGLDPTIAMTEQVSKLKEAYDAGYLSLEQYNREMENIAGLKKRTTALQDALDAFDREILGKGAGGGGEEIKTLLEELQTEAGRWADQFANTLVSGLADGKLAFKDFADYVLQQLARIAISKALEPIFAAFSNGIGNLFAVPEPATVGLVATPAPEMPMARAGIAAQPMIVGVPRSGSVSSGSRSPVNIVVNNNNGSDVSVNERETSRGLEIEVLIERSVKKSFASGSMDKIMATNYGARRLAF